MIRRFRQIVMVTPFLGFPFGCATVDPMTDNTSTFSETTITAKAIENPRIPQKPRFSDKVLIPYKAHTPRPNYNRPLPTEVLQNIPSRVEPDPRIVRKAQRILASAGYYSGVVDGQYDLQTQIGLAKYRSDHQEGATNHKQALILLSANVEANPKRNAPVPVNTPTLDSSSGLLRDQEKSLEDSSAEKPAKPHPKPASSTSSTDNNSEQAAPLTTNPESSIPAEDLDTPELYLTDTNNSDTENLMQQEDDSPQSIAQNTVEEFVTAPKEAPSTELQPVTSQQTTRRLEIEVELKEKPDPYSATQKILKPNTLVIIINKTQRWVEVKVGSSRGYIFGALLD